MFSTSNFVRMLLATLKLKYTANISSNIGFFLLDWNSKKKIRAENYLLVSWINPQTLPMRYSMVYNMLSSSVLSFELDGSASLNSSSVASEGV